MPKIRHEFDVHLLNEEGIAKARSIALSFSVLMDHHDDIPACREKSLAITKLQEAAFWMKRAIAIDTQYQKNPQ